MIAIAVHGDGPGEERAFLGLLLMELAEYRGQVLLRRLPVDQAAIVEGPAQLEGTALARGMAARAGVHEDGLDASDKHPQRGRIVSDRRAGRRLGLGVFLG